MPRESAAHRIGSRRAAAQAPQRTIGRFRGLTGCPARHRQMDGYAAQAAPHAIGICRAVVRWPASHTVGSLWALPRAHVREQPGSLRFQAHLHFSAVPMPILWLVNSFHCQRRPLTKFQLQTTRFRIFTIFIVFRAPRILKICGLIVLAPNLAGYILVFLL